MIIKKQVLTLEEWKNILGSDWKLHPSNDFFLYVYDSMIVGNNSKLNQILDLQNISADFDYLNWELSLEDISKIIERKNSFIIVKFGGLDYDFILIGEAFRILGSQISLLQNKDGMIMLKTDFLIVYVMKKL